MKTLTTTSLLLLAGTLAACGGGSGYMDWGPGGGYGEIWLFEAGAEVGQVEIQNDPVDAAGRPNELAIVKISYCGRPLEGLQIPPGGTFPLDLDASLDHFFTFEYEDGTTATRTEPEAPLRVSAGQTVPLRVTR